MQGVWSGMFAPRICSAMGAPLCCYKLVQWGALERIYPFVSFGAVLMCVIDARSQGLYPRWITRFFALMNERCTYTLCTFGALNVPSCRIILSAIAGPKPGNIIISFL